MATVITHAQNAVAGGKLPQARLTILYCSPDRLRRCGAAVKNLPPRADSGEFHA
jgi:hypothetical protein